MSPKRETKTQKAERLEQARNAAAAALFSEYERWNERRFLDNGKPYRCSTHDEEECRLCHPGKNRNKPLSPRPKLSNNVVQDSTPPKEKNQ